MNGEIFITGPLSTRKGIEISMSNKVALSFWWTATERQVRIQSDATKISYELADKYFKKRSWESQLVSFVSKQGSILENPDALHYKYQNAKTVYDGKKIPRPYDWGGYAIKLIRIEFLEFQETRFHKRTLYKWKDEKWDKKYLQP